MHYFDVFETTLQQYVGRSFTVCHPALQRTTDSAQNSLAVVGCRFREHVDATSGALEFAVQPVTYAGLRLPLDRCTRIQLKWIE